MEGAVTSQPGSNFGFGDTNGEKFPGLQALAYAKELTVKQRRPGCLECKNNKVLVYDIAFKYH